MHFVVVPTAVSTELEIICGLVLIGYKHAHHGGFKLHSGKTLLLQPWQKFLLLPRK